MDTATILTAFAAWVPGFYTPSFDTVLYGTLRPPCPVVVTMVAATRGEAVNAGAAREAVYSAAALDSVR